MLTTQINHISDDIMIHRESKVQRQESWSVHQVLTAQDFAQDSYFWWIIGGGLNFQIEHHLFPGVNHEHLPKLVPIVKRLCEKHGIRYVCEPDYTAALVKYIDVIKQNTEKYGRGTFEKYEKESGKKLVLKWEFKSEDDTVRFGLLHAKQSNTKDKDREHIIKLKKVKNSTKEKIVGEYEATADGHYFLTFHNDTYIHETSVTYFLHWEHV